MSFAVDRLVQDIRALGSSGLARAAYEASKRSGFHAVVFSTRRRPQDLRSATVVLGNVEPTAAWVREHTLDDAKAVLAEGVRIFGQRLPIGVSEPWNRDPLIGRQWPVSPPWWRIDIRSANRLGDVKYVWEAARHRDLVVLARASRLDPSGPWPDALNRMVLTWCRQNRPERGVNWYSSLELALRTIAWSQVIALAGDQLAAPARSGMDEQMQATAQHLMLELPYTSSSMKNNHLLGDALGLLVLARMFPQSRSARWWSYVGERLFEKQLARHMRPDGSMIEDSLSYHRFVLEMLIVRTLLGGESDRVRVALPGRACTWPRLASSTARCLSTATGTRGACWHRREIPRTWLVLRHWAWRWPASRFATNGASGTTNLPGTRPSPRRCHHQIVRRGPCRHRAASPTCITASGMCGSRWGAVPRTAMPTSPQSG